MKKKKKKTSFLIDKSIKGNKPLKPSSRKPEAMRGGDLVACTFVQRLFVFRVGVLLDCF